MEGFINSLPKAELHMHLEGALEPELLLKLAERNGVQLPYNLDELKSRRESYENLMDFLREFNIGTLVLKNYQDFYDMIWSYLLKCSQQNIVYTEIMINVGRYTDDVSLNSVMEAYRNACRDAEAKLGVKAKFILNILKNSSYETNLRMVESCAPYKDLIIGFGVAGAELASYSSSLKPICERAKELGLCGTNKANICSHAGEEGDPSHVIDALCGFHAVRIDHGVRCLEDPFLVKALVNLQVPLTVCPLSNQKLKVLERYFGGNHVVGRMIEAGLMITINSDDPAFFGGYLCENFLEVVKSLSHLSEQEIKGHIKQLCKNSFLAAFISDEEKIHYCNLVDQAYCQQS